jgi:hypothetical protein
MSIVDGWVLGLCSGAVGQVRFCADQMDSGDRQPRDGLDPLVSRGPVGARWPSRGARSAVAAALSGQRPRGGFTATVLGGLADRTLALAIGHPLLLLWLVLLAVGLLRRPRG